MKICLITGGNSSRFDDFMAEIVHQYPCAIQSMPDEAEIFFVDYLRKNAIKWISKYHKPVYLIGYSAIQHNPRIFITKIGENNE